MEVMMAKSSIQEKLKECQGTTETRETTLSVLNRNGYAHSRQRSKEGKQLSLLCGVSFFFFF